LHCRVVVAKALLIVANRDGQLQCRSLIFFILRLNSVRLEVEQNQLVGVFE
jgi:hypothetical protein